MKKVVYSSCFGGFSVSKVCAEWMADRGNTECMELLEHDDFYGCLDDTPRHDALLVMAVEHLGTKKASGSSARLTVHELRGDRYYIDEYDGAESVVEPDDVEWIEV